MSNVTGIGLAMVVFGWAWPGSAAGAQYWSQEGRPSAGDRMPALGVQVGMFAPRAGDRLDYEPGYAIDVLWRRGMRGRTINWELGVGYATSEAKSGEEETTIFLGRLNGILHIAGRDKASLYGVGSLLAITETAKHKELGEFENVGTAAEAGLGLSLMGSRLDLRVSYRHLLDSENTDGLVVASVGLFF